MFRGIKSFSHIRAFGFSSLEMMVAIGVLATIFILAMPFFSQQGKIIKQIRTSSNCQAILDTAFSRINSFGNSLDAYQATKNPSFNDLPELSGTEAAKQNAYLFPPIPANNFDPDFAAQRAATLALAPPSAPPSPAGPMLYSENPPKNISIPNGAGSSTTQTIQHDGVTLYTPLLLKGSMEYLATKYLATKYGGAGHCDTFAPVNLLTSFDKEALGGLYQGGMKDLKLSLKVGRFNLATNQASSYSCDDRFWPRPRNGARTDTTYEPQFGVGAGRQIIGQFPSWIKAEDGFRVALRASYTNDRGATEDCDATRDFSLPEDKQNTVDYFYDVNYVKSSTADPTKIDDNYAPMRSGTTCNGGSCLGHAFEPILTNLQSYKVDPKWPEHRNREVCTQIPSNSMDLVMKIRVYNTQKEPGLVPMCMDTSKQWFKNAPGGKWCAGSINGGAETSFDTGWSLRYTGWVPCEHMQFCNLRPDKVEVVKSSATNSKFSGLGISQPYTEYKYSYNGINGDKDNSRMWGCEMKFGVAMLDMAGNLSYVPATEGELSDDDVKNLVTWDKRPPIKEINPRVYFKPPPCYTCTCKPCKGGKGLFGGLFNWILFVVLVVVTGGIWGVVAGAFFGLVCLVGGLGCGTDGGSTYTPDSTGGTYRACKDINNGCSCGQKCNSVRIPGPSWTSSLEGSPDGSKKLEDNSCKPGNTFYYNGVPMNNVEGMTPTLAYKTPNTLAGGYNYFTDPVANKIQPGDEVLWSAFNASTRRFCYVAARCAQGQLRVILETNQAAESGETEYPLMGCSPVKVGKRIEFPGTLPGIAKGGDACLEVQFDQGPQNPGNKPLWSWANYNEQCLVTDATAALSSNPKVVAGNCPVGSPTSSYSTTGATYTATGPGCAKPTASMTDIANLNFACKYTKKYWDPCNGGYTDADGNYVPTCFNWCYADCKVPEYIPEHPWVEPFGGKIPRQRYYEPMSSSDASLNFCTMNRKQFDVGF